ncbi:BPSL0761 family protein [Caballeronia sp. NCTM5]|uniref:BPSL0761 family protein n=1 Tax=Caballeronia sp. NCTM5 TaxID=2921755 RepID=UPI0020284892|nr:BPSL0761 family protein [Caballeronia sp. NCTM5]
MTTPDERTNALLGAAKLLKKLAKRRKDVEISTLRSEASRLLRHYPDAGLLFLIARQSTWLAAPNLDTGARTTPRELPAVEHWKSSETAENFMMKLREAELENRRADIRAGRLMDETRFRARLGLTKGTLRRLVASGSVFFIVVDEQNYYPEVFIREENNRKRLYEVCRILWPAPPEVRSHYLNSRQGNLGGLTPLQCLADKQNYRRLKKMAYGFAIEYHRTTLVAYAGNHESEPENVAVAASYDVAAECDPRTPVWRRCLDAMSSHGYEGVFPPYVSLKSATIFASQLRAGYHPPQRLARLNISVEGDTAHIRVERFESRAYGLEVPVEGPNATIEAVMRAAFGALLNRDG